jgi:hypothetical protein
VPVAHRVAEAWLWIGLVGLRLVTLVSYLAAVI